MQSLNDLGITSNGTDNTLAVDSATLNTALGNNLDAVKQMFTDPTNGLATKLSSFLTNTTGSNGVLATQEASFTSSPPTSARASPTCNRRFPRMKPICRTNSWPWKTAISTINTQKQYLTDFFNEPTSASAGAWPTGSARSSSSSSSTGYAPL